jgi:hypothetical protein
MTTPAGRVLAEHAVAWAPGTAAGRVATGRPAGRPREPEKRPRASSSWSRAREGRPPKRSRRARRYARNRPSRQTRLPPAHGAGAARTHPPSGIRDANTSGSSSAHAGDAPSAASMVRRQARLVLSMHLSGADDAQPAAVSAPAFVWRRARTRVAPAPLVVPQTESAARVRCLAACATRVTRLRRPDRVDCSGSARGRSGPR